MRRTFQRMTVGVTTTCACFLVVGPAIAEVTFDTEEAEGTSTWEVNDEKKEEKGGGGDDGSEEAASGAGNGGGGGGGGGTEVPVDAYSGYVPPDNVEILPDGTRITYGSGGATVTGENGTRGPVGFLDGATQPEPEPSEPVEESDEPAQEEVDVQTLVVSATTELDLDPPVIASTPNDPDTLGAVGLPVWFWVSNPGPETTGPNSTSATAGSVTVTVTATFSGMTIDTGDGNTIECAGPGTEYPGTGIEESPDCGHIYEQMSDDQPDGLYTVGITAHWEIQWEATTGESGTIPMDLTTDKQLRIGSYQAVVTG